MDLSGAHGAGDGGDSSPRAAGTSQRRERSTSAATQSGRRRMDVVEPQGARHPARRAPRVLRAPVR